MADAKRSAIMRAVKSENTTPERTVRAMARELGFRCRTNCRNLPGQPDLVFGPGGAVIFVHGCFWHGHSCKRGARLPKTNAEYWMRKITRNAQRYSVQQRQLRRDGWRVMTVWECELRNRARLQRRLERFLLP